MSTLPVILSQQSVELTPQEQDLLLKLYSETCNSWRQLTDVRFKLLGFVPAVSVLVLVGLFKGDQGPVGPEAPLVVSVSRVLPLAGIALVALLATLGFWIYDRRNSGLYNDLISRARRIEAELGVHTGQFLGRLDSSSWVIKHDAATGLVYGASIAGWIGALVVLVSPLLFTMS